MLPSFPFLANDLRRIDLQICSRVKVSSVHQRIGSYVNVFVVLSLPYLLSYSVDQFPNLVVDCGPTRIYPVKFLQRKYCIKNHFQICKTKHRFLFRNNTTNTNLFNTTSFSDDPSSPSPFNRFCIRIRLSILIKHTFQTLFKKNVSAP